jgi:hypothetical protein
MNTEKINSIGRKVIAMAGMALQFIVDDAALLNDIQEVLLHALGLVLMVLPIVAGIKQKDKKNAELQKAKRAPAVLD